MTTKQNMIDAIARQGRITTDQAAKVLAVYVNVKAIKYGVHDGYTIKHGAFMDRDVILRALSQSH
jgi:nucleoid DNA-binding protein